MRVWIVTETNEHDTHDYTDGTEVVGVYEHKGDALAIVSARFHDESEGRDLDVSEDSGNWIDHNGGYLRDEQDKCETYWTIEPHEIW